MNPEDFKKAIKTAKEIVSDVEEPYRMDAFKIILSHLIEFPYKGRFFERRSGIEADIQEPTLSDVEGKRADLAHKCKISISQLDDTISVEDGTVSLLVPLSGSETQKQIKAAQCILFAQEIMLGTEWLSAMNLSKCIDRSGIGGLSNLATSLKSKPEIFRKQGSGRSTMYKLTGPGRTSAAELIRRLATQPDS